MSATQQKIPSIAHGYEEEEGFNLMTNSKWLGDSALLILF